MKIYLQILITLSALCLFLSISISAQTNFLQDGISLYKKGSFKKAILTLKKINKSDKNLFLSHYFMGLSYEKMNKYREARKEFRKSINLNGDFSKAKTELANIYVQSRKNKKAIKLAEEAIALDNNDYRSYYVLALAYYRLKQNTKALEYVDKVLRLNPNFASAYFIKYNVFDIEAFIKKDKSRKESDALAEKERILGIFITHLADSKNAGRWEKQRDSLNFYKEYYKQRDSHKKEQENGTKLKILSKSEPGYTTRARTAGISGSVRLLVVFQSDGKVEHPLVLQSLGYGLDENAIKATKKIIFEPVKVNGKAVDTVKTIVYGFATY